MHPLTFAICSSECVVGFSKLIFNFFNQNLVALNLWGNKLQNAETILLEIAKCRNLKALWLNENPVLKNL